MTPRQSLSLVLLGIVGLFPSCAAHYQDLLRDRDSQIRELEAQLADARAEAAELLRREQEALARLSSQPAPVEASDDGGLAASLQRELGDDTDVRYKSGRLSIGIENTVTFTSGSTELKPSAGAVLRKVADVLRRDFGGRRIYVEGHTDTDPIRKTAGKFRSNRHLSMERADAVARYLIEQCGLDEAKVVVAGYGPFDPRVPGSGEAVKSKNRRVEIVVAEML